MYVPTRSIGEFLCIHILDNAWYGWCTFEESTITPSTLKITYIIKNKCTVAALLKIMYTNAIEESPMPTSLPTGVTNSQRDPVSS